MRDWKLDELVVGEVLRERARTHRREPFLRFDEGDVTFGETDEMANRFAQGFAAMGVGRGDHVAMMLPNSADLVFVVFALAKLGAVVVPINTAYKGELLRHALDSSDATTFVVDEPYFEVADAVLDRVPDVGRLVVRGDVSAAMRSIPLTALLEHGDEDPKAEVAFSDLQAIMYTSGTTGPSKGVMTPHALALTCALDNLTFLDRWGKTLYCPLPLFHAGGLWDGVFAALLSGSPIGIVERFSASRFWDDVRRFGAQGAMGVFAMMTILLKRSPSPQDTEHPLETFYMGKSALDAPMRERFGVRAPETYTSTEAGIPTASPFGEWRKGSCGLENSERFVVRIVDPHDREVGPGEPGEIVVRPRQPYVITTGYYGFWRHTAHVFRNQWFHTGDRAWRDEDGYFYFLDRMSDAIRRRGENISAFDLECEVNLHPAVLECAAIGVPSEFEDEEVKVAVVLRPEADLTPEELVAFCEDRLPAFMVPRYVEFTEELPRSSTGKIAKHELRALGDAGITPETWDRETQPVSEVRA